MANPYLLRGAPLRTGLGLPQTRLWAFCNVVVLRPSAQKKTFTVKMSLDEITPGGTNDCLFRAITARVPFAEWAKMESYCKDMDTHIAGRNRRDRCTRSPYEWPSWSEVREENTVVTEESARNRIYEVQYEMYHSCIDPDENNEWTVVIYARRR